MQSYLKKETFTALGYFQVDLKTNEITYTDESRYMLGLAESCNRSFDYFLTCLHPNSIGLVYRAAKMGIKNKTNFRLIFSLGIGKKKKISWLEEKLSMIVLMSQNMFSGLFLI